MCYNSSSYKSVLVICPNGAEMKKFRYSLVLLLCGLMFIITGCGKDKVSVVNAKSGVVIHSEDFTDSLQDRAKTSAKVKQVSAPTARSTGKVIHLGDGYEKIEMGPLFDTN